MAGPERILLINPFGIGDVLFTTPLVRAIKQAFPESRLTYLCNRRTEEILRHNPYVDELIIYEKDEVVRAWQTSWLAGLRAMAKLLRQIRGIGADLVIDVSLGERYSFALKLLGARRRVGFDYRHRGRFLTDRLVIDGYTDGHVVEYYRCLLRWLGIELLDGSLELRVADEHRQWADRWLADRQLPNGQLLVGMVPAGGVSWGLDAPFRRWSAEGFAAVGDALIERHGAQVLLFGEAADRSLCQTVARLMRHPAVDVSGQTTLGQFIGLLGRLDLVICNDGGPLHIAVSQRVRTVSIFGPVNPLVYGPYGPAEQHRVVTKPLPCRPCYHQFRLPPCPYNRACLNELSVEDVFTAVQEVLEQPMRPAAGRSA